jgi:acetylornithine aminotransferase
MDFKTLKQRDRDSLCPTYGRYPVAAASAGGTTITDLEGKKYLDLLAGIAVCNLGHSHPELVRTMSEQAEKLIHVSNLFFQEEQVVFAEKLLATCALDKVFFCNSGAEANEGAIKAARRYMQRVRNRDAFEVITLEGSFHGRTLATLTATGQDKIKDGFAPLPSGFRTAPFNDLAALEEAISEQTAAIMLEPIQGEGGVRPLSLEYIQGVRGLCDTHDILLIVDEIQTGMGRTGTMWAHQHSGIVPDIMTSAKGLANGLPAGAVLMSDKVAEALGPGTHGTTFGGTAMVSAVGTKVLEIMERDNICGQADAKGAFLKNSLQQVKDRFPDRIATIRGAGLMVGIELTFPGQEVWQELLNKGFILNLTQNTVLRLLPPLIVSEQELTTFCDALAEVLKQV